MTTNPLRSEPRVVQAKAALLLALCLAHLLVTAQQMVPGYVSIDELVYHQMATTMVRDGSLEIWNGYDERPSAELSHHTLRPHDGRLFPRYPWLNAVLGAVAVRLAGISGLFWLNALAWLLAVGCCFGLARRLLGTTSGGLDACLLLTLAGFAWSYSQAIWPHASAMAWVSLALYCGVRGCHEPREGRAWLWSGAAGLVTGLAMGLRLDGLLVVPGLVALHLFQRPLRVRRVAAIAVGCLPGLLILSGSNLVKFGSFSFLHYGPSPLSIGLATYAALAAIIALLLIAWRSPEVWLDWREVRDLLILAGFAWLLLSVDPERNIALAAARLRASLIDFRSSGLDDAEGLQRTVTGGFVYLDGLKKSALQSLPYLPILLLPLAGAWRDKTQRCLLLGLGATFASFALVPYAKFHCGQALNTRYLVSALPCLAVLLAWCLQLLRERLPGRLGPGLIALGGVVGAIVFLAAVLPWQDATPREHEWVLLSLPLLVSGCLAASSLAMLASRWRVWSGCTCLLLGFGLVWAGAVSFGYDYPRERARRAANAMLTEQLSPHIAADALVFANYVEPLGPLHERKLRIARPFTDEFADFAALARFHLSAGRAVYGLFHPLNWRRYAGRGELAGFEVIELVDVRRPRVRLARLKLKDTGH